MAARGKWRRDRFLVLTTNDGGGEYVMFTCWHCNVVHSDVSDGRGMCNMEMASGWSFGERRPRGFVTQLD